MVLIGHAFHPKAELAARTPVRDVMRVVAERMVRSSIQWPGLPHVRLQFIQQCVAECTGNGRACRAQTYMIAIWD
jgi:hypothetical protein